MEIVGFLFIDISITFSSLFCKALRVQGICKQPDNTEHCCTDYRQKGDVCLPCLGSFGKNCTGGACTEGYYGHGCKDRCNCSISEVCNRSVGCQKISVPHGTVIDTRIHHVVIITLSGCTLLLLILLMGLVFRRKMSTSDMYVGPVDQRGNVISNNTDSQSYASMEHQGYLECDLATMNNDCYSDNQIERIDSGDVSSGQYIPVHPILPPRVDVHQGDCGK